MLSTEAVQVQISIPNYFGLNMVYFDKSNKQYNRRNNNGMEKRSTTSKAYRRALRNKNINVNYNGGNN